MKWLTKICIALGSLIGVSVLIGGVFLLSNNIVGTIVFLLAYIALIGISIMSFSGMVKGESNYLKTTNKFTFFLIFSNAIMLSFILLGAWALNFLVQNQVGTLSAGEKISLVQNQSLIREADIESVTKDYEELVHKHITFRYHADSQNQVEGMLATLEDITLLEEEVYGREISKTDSVEVIVFPQEEYYFEVNTHYTIADGGLYIPGRKTIMVYHERDYPDVNDAFVISTFVHEYSHYLYDMFVSQEGLNRLYLPVWYDEGIAELMSNRVTNSERPYWGLEGEVSFEELHTQKQWEDGLETTDVYLLAQTAVEYVVGSQGTNQVLSEILLHQKETDSFSESFHELTGVPIEELHLAIFTIDEELDIAWAAWNGESDFEKADELYEDILDSHPRNQLAWHQYALMLEQQKRWDEALEARRTGILIAPNNSTGYLNIAYLLVLSDSVEALEMAEKALELNKQDPEENETFSQQWVDEVSRYNDLISEERYSEAYGYLLQSEQLAFHESMMEEMNELYTESLND